MELILTSSQFSVVLCFICNRAFNHYGDKQITVLPNFVFHMTGVCCPATVFGVVKIISNNDQVVQTSEIPYLPKFKTRILS